MSAPKASFSLHPIPPPADSGHRNSDYSDYSESMPSDLGRDAELMQRVLLARSKPRPSALRVAMAWCARVAEWCVHLWRSALAMIGVKR